MSMNKNMDSQRKWANVDIYIYAFMLFLYIRILFTRSYHKMGWSIVAKPISFSDFIIDEH